MSPDRVLVMFFYMHIVEHECNDMSDELLSGACGCEFSTLTSINTFARLFFLFVGSESKSCRTSFACYSSPIPD